MFLHDGRRGSPYGLFEGKAMSLSIDYFAHGKSLPGFLLEQRDSKYRET